MRLDPATDGRVQLSSAERKGSLQTQPRFGLDNLWGKLPRPDDKHNTRLNGGFFMAMLRRETSAAQALECNRLPETDCYGSDFSCNAFDKTSACLCSGFSVSDFRNACTACWCH